VGRLDRRSAWRASDLEIATYAGHRSSFFTKDR
jgi:hypothetical protein